MFSHQKAIWKWPQNIPNGDFEPEDGIADHHSGSARILIKLRPLMFQDRLDAGCVKWELLNRLVSSRDIGLGPSVKFRSFRFISFALPPRNTQGLPFGVRQLDGTWIESTRSSQVPQT
jgi:hypothetical protein